MYINLLTQLKNAQAVKKGNIKVPYSKMDERVLEILKRNRYVEDYARKGRGVKRVLDIKLKYQNKEGAIQGVKFVSKPSRRIYLDYRQARPVKGGYGLLVISTSKGIMTDKEARRLKLGGEALFEIW